MQGLRVSPHMAFIEARQTRHEFITTKHLLLASLDNPTATGVLRACTVNIEDLHTHLKNFIAGNIPVVPGVDEVDTQPTLGSQRVTQRAIVYVQPTSNGKKEATGANVLVAIFGEKDSHAVYYFQQQGMTRLDVVNFISHGIRENQAGPTGQGEGNPEGKDGDGKENPLGQFTQNLNALTKADKIDPLIGREQEAGRVVQVPCRRHKNSPLLVGEAGVGKTAIAEGLAWHVTKDKVPDIFAKSVVCSLDMGTLLAGTKYRGDFGQRLKGVLKSLKDNPSAILFIDEIHMLIDAGAVSDDVLDASNLLKPVLSSDALKCIGATMFTEYRGIFEKDTALSRRFQKIDMVELTVDQAVQILRGLKSRLREHHGVRHTSSALTVTAELSARLITDRHLLDKAIDVIDEADVVQRILPKSKRKGTIDKGEIEVIVSRIACVPPQSVSQDSRSKLQIPECDLRSVVFGQDPVIDALVSAIKMPRASLGKTDKPIGSSLFSDPTDAGKTEVAKQFVFILGIELIRFDMSECVGRHAVGRLIGAPSGYMGFDQGGLPTETMAKKPHCVLPLDKIKKTYPDIFNILLQVMDHGALTDNDGRKADFRNVIIIITTSAGAKTMNKTTISLAMAREQGDEMADIKRMFTPEFHNRLGATISFRSLDKGIIMRVADELLMQLKEQLHGEKVDVAFTERLRRFLAKKGFSPLMGVRPMQRLIRDLIRKVLVDELLFGELVNGGEVVVDLDGADAVKLGLSENEVPPAPIQEEAEA